MKSIEVLKIRRQDLPANLITASELKSILLSHCNADDVVAFTTENENNITVSYLTGVTLQGKVGESNKLIIIHTAEA